MLEFMSVKLWHKLDETSRPQDGRQQLYCLQVCQFHVMLWYVMLCYAHKIYLQDCKQWRLHFPHFPHLSYILHVTFSVGYCPIT